MHSGAGSFTGTTAPFNTGTTASDALWWDAPVLTCAGEAFASRMAGSLLNAVGLPELITYSVEEYEALALKLSPHPLRQAQDRPRLRRFAAQFIPTPSTALGINFVPVHPSISSLRSAVHLSTPSWPPTLGTNGARACLPCCQS